MIRFSGVHPFIERARASSRSLLLLLVLSMVAVVYFPLTRVYFSGDDFVHLSESVDRGFVYFWLRPWAGHLYLVRNVLLCAPYWLFGFRSEPYGWMALALQLLNTWLLFRVTFNLTDSTALAALGAALWGTCLLQSGALGWFCVHGLVFAGTTLLFVLDRLTAPREQEAVSTPLAVLCAVVLWVGANCFGVGTGVALASPLIIALLVPGSFRVRGAAAAFVAVPPLVVATYFGSLWLYHRIYGPLPYGSVFVVPIALFDYRPEVRMLGAMLRVGTLGLVWGPAFVPDADPATAAWSTIGPCLLLVAGAFVVANGVVRRRMAGLVVLALSAYGIIALGRANLLGLEKVVWGAKAARYHYVGTIPLALLLVLSIAQWVQLLRRPAALSAAVLATWVPLAAYLFAKKTWVINEYKPCRQLVATTRKAIETEVDAHPPGTTVTFKNEPILTCAWSQRTSDLFIIAYPSNELRGRPVRFYMDDPSERRRYGAAGHRRFTDLLVPPPGMPDEQIDPQSQALASGSSACDRLKSIYDRASAKRGCPKNGWTPIGKLCLAVMPGPICSPEKAALVSCMEAAADTLPCKENGELEFPGNACAAQTDAMMSCAAW